MCCQALQNVRFVVLISSKGHSHTSSMCRLTFKKSRFLYCHIRLTKMMTLTVKTVITRTIHRYSIQDQMTENIQHDSSMGQKESLSQSEQVQILPKPADVVGPSDHGHNQTASASTQAAVKISNELDMNFIIDRLLEARDSRPGKQVQLLEREIRYLCTKAKEILISQPILLELKAPIKVISPTCSISNVLLADIIRFLVISTANIMIS